jgi:hypothetical protein
MMERDKFAAYNVVATFPDMERARHAISALERGGVEGVNISLLGRAAEEAATNPDARERDAGVTKDVTKAAVAGGAAGTGVGAAAGFVGGALAFGIPGIGPVIGSAVWAATLGGAGVGAAIGGLVGGTAATSQGETWEQTYQESIHSGRVLVGVHSDDQAVVDQAIPLLEKQEPVRVDRLDSSGRRIGG